MTIVIKRAATATRTTTTAHTQPFSPPPPPPLLRRPGRPARRLQGLQGQAHGRGQEEHNGMLVGVAQAGGSHQRCGRVGGVTGGFDASV